MCLAFLLVYIVFIGIIWTYSVYWNHPVDIVFIGIIGLHSGIRARQSQSLLSFRACRVVGGEEWGLRKREMSRDEPWRRPLGNAYGSEKMGQGWGWGGMRQQRDGMSLGKCRHGRHN